MPSKKDPDLMEINYDPEADAIYIQLRLGEVDDTLQAGKYVFVDVDVNGVPLGLEILFASRILASEGSTSFTVNVGQISRLLSTPVLAD